MTSATSLHASPIFGPVHSRRLGLSLGINLLPGDGKRCTFDCLYCECGLNSERKTTSPLPSRQDVRIALEKELTDLSENGRKLDVITFAGNGEPTLHPDFPLIVDDVITLRNRYFPKARISVLSNATQILRPKVFEALNRVDNNILKLDTTDPEFIKLICRPAANYSVETIVDRLCEFKGHVVIQTMFLKGTVGGRHVDNTTTHYVAPWIETLRKINPEMIMIYTIDRPTPDTTLKKATPAELDSIASKLKECGFKVSVSY